ncbi:MAG: tRNA-(ms[2]io[6]A)-hydroxylase [Thiolinea sp.]
MLNLRYQTPDEWTKTVLTDFDTFLLDHAAAEKKASGMAMSMVSHYPDKTAIVREMTDIAVEEMVHFKQVVRLILERGIMLGPDEKDPYIHQLRKLFRQGTELFLLDRLLIAGIIEARGYERFSLIAEALGAGKEKQFYQAIAKSEAKHAEVFIELAALYFSQNEISERLDELLDEEAAICAKLPLRSALH